MTKHSRRNEQQFIVASKHLSRVRGGNDPGQSVNLRRRISAIKSQVHAPVQLERLHRGVAWLAADAVVVCLDDFVRASFQNRYSQFVPALTTSPTLEMSPKGCQPSQWDGICTESFGNQAEKE